MNEENISLQDKRYWWEWFSIFSGRGAECHSGECLQDGLCSGKGKTTHIQRVDRTAAYSAEGKVPGIYALMQLSSEFVDSLCVTRVWQAPVSDYIYHAGRHVKMEEELVQVCFVDKYRVWIKNGKGGGGLGLASAEKPKSLRFDLLVYLWTCVGYFLSDSILKESHKEHRKNMSRGIPVLCCGSRSMLRLQSLPPERKCFWHVYRLWDCLHFPFIWVMSCSE